VQLLKDEKIKFFRRFVVNKWFFTKINETFQARLGLDLFVITNDYILRKF